jgi:hypothetical protein
MNAIADCYPVLLAVPMGDFIDARTVMGLKVIKSRAIPPGKVLCVTDTHLGNIIDLVPEHCLRVWEEEEWTTTHF